MNESLFDDIFKQKAKETNVEIPPSVREGIKQVISQIPEHRRKYNKFGVLAAVSVFALVILLGVSIFSPAVSSALDNVPVLGNMIRYTREIGGSNEFSFDVNQTVVDKGIGMTLNQISYKGSELRLIYTIAAEGNDVYQPRIDGLCINGEKVFINDELTQTNKIDGNKRTYTKKLYLSKKLGDEFNLISINNMEANGDPDNTIRGTWLFNINVGKNAKAGKAYKSGEEKSADNSDKKGEKVVLSSADVNGEKNAEKIEDYKQKNLSNTYAVNSYTENNSLAGTGSVNAAVNNEKSGSENIDASVAESVFALSTDKGVNNVYKQNLHTSVNKTVESTDIKMTVNEAVYDGYRLCISYTIDSYDNVCYIPDLIMTGSTKINGKGDYKPSTLGPVDYENKSNVGIITYYIDRSEIGLKELDAEEIKVSLNIKKMKPAEQFFELAGIEGNWQFDIDVRKISASESVFDEQKPSLKAGRRDIIVTNVVLSPLETIITVQTVQPYVEGEKMEKDNMGYEFRDDKGNVIKLRSSTSNNAVEDGMFIRTYTYVLEPVNDTANYILFKKVDGTNDIKIPLAK